ncbi:hypothetical protein [Roseobacter sp. OBYS 0001]|uniref:hypothetical protein n=1 Tax=Roseobacter sp. OBYS 0001 TaxID=882651 RepID=UPI001BBDEC94|nr:hypothetical protein [Roseobacter sp. OBYS 0001]GIT86172.1 hypothetical protein ROBYS_11880 [Roseobacter sp. OBYS 0001]
MVPYTSLTATVDGTSATLVAKTLSTSAPLIVKGASYPKGPTLADDLEACLSVDHEGAKRGTYRIDTVSFGVVLHNDGGQMTIPWQHITDVVAQLRA